MRRRICPGCGDLIVGDCPRGCVKSGKRQTPHRVAHQQLHQSKEWKRFRSARLIADQFRCCLCRRTLSSRGVYVCDLLVPLEAFAFKLEQAQTLCLRCSGEKDGGRRLPSAKVPHVYMRRGLGIGGVVRRGD